MILVKVKYLPDFSGFPHLITSLVQARFGYQQSAKKNPA